MRAGEVDVLCVGETMASLVPAARSRLETATTLMLHAAGAESNVAMCLAALGHRTAWGSMLGDDPLGRRLLSLIREAGVDVSLVGIDPRAPTGVMFKDSEPGASSVYYYRRGSAAAGMGADTVPDLKSVRPNVVHMSGVTVALSASCAELVRRVVVEREVGEASVSFDVNHRARLWSAADAAPILLDLARAADIVFVGLDEAAALWGTSSAEQVRGLLPQAPTLVVKDAAVGATAFVGSAVYFALSPRVRVLEHVGAGDAFAAGWLAGVIRGLRPVQRLRLAHVAAAAALASVGDQGTLPAPAEIDRLLALDDEQWRRLVLGANPESLAGRRR